MKIYNTTRRCLASLSIGILTMTAISACNDDDNNTSSSTTPDNSLDNVNPVMLEILRNSDSTNLFVGFDCKIVSATPGPINFTVGSTLLDENLQHYAEDDSPPRFRTHGGDVSLFAKDDTTHIVIMSSQFNTTGAPITFRENGFTITRHFLESMVPADGKDYYIPSTFVLSFDFNEATGQFIMNSQESYIVYDTQTVFLTADPIAAPLP